MINFLALLAALLWHELGHFVAFKLMKVPVQEVSLGMGPRLLKVTDGTNTEWSVRAFPFVGYVAPHRLIARHPGKRMIAVLCGPGMNLIPVLLLAIFQKQVVEIFAYIIKLYGDAYVVVGKTLWEPVRLLTGTATRVVSKTDPFDMHRIYADFASQFHLGANDSNFFRWFILWNVNLALVNMLPIPVLDGGQIFFVGTRAVLSKDKAEQVNARIYRVGLAIIGLSMIFAGVINQRGLY